MPGSKELYRGRIVHLWVDEVTLPTGARVSLEVVRHPGAAAIVAIDDRGEVTLIRQFRHAAGGFIWEIPAGVLNDGEKPEACALRELREETGLLAGELTSLGSILTTPGFCDERIYLFLARRCRATEQELDADEVLTVSQFPLRTALDMIRRGEIQDAKSIAGLHHAQAYLADERQ
jgi:ADP-ribose pyrophosphatase